MNGSNGQFIGSPDAFISANVVNNVRWMQKAGNPMASASERGLVSNADNRKRATFDLVREEVIGGKNVYDLVITQQAVVQDQAITAWWCPFYQGTGLPGYVDVPKNNPEHRFVFTPPMNGCSFVVAQSPLNANALRIYHNQHPGMDAVEKSIKSDLKDSEIISTFTFAEYGQGNNPNAFNFMYFNNNSQWVFISQPQTLNMQTRQVGFRPAGKVTVKKVL